MFLYKLALKSAVRILSEKENAEFINSKGIIKEKQKINPGSGVNLDYFPDKESLIFYLFQEL